MTVRSAERNGTVCWCLSEFNRPHIIIFVITRAPVGCRWPCPTPFLIADGHSITAAMTFVTSEDYNRPIYTMFTASHYAREHHILWCHVNVCAIVSGEMYCDLIASQNLVRCCKTDKWCTVKWQTAFDLFDCQCIGLFRSPRARAHRLIDTLRGLGLALFIYRCR